MMCDNGTKLDIKILKNDIGIINGGYILKSLQNDRVPELDLLVREAIQNSSDASLNVEGDSYTVKFKTGTFRPASFNAYMTKVTDTLNDRFPGESADFLEIRDEKTSGLTGPVKKEEAYKNSDHGNFFRLVYDTGREQTIESAGGNWGLGKSVYYRVGIGIVIFYSRINDGAESEERLIITLIENEQKKNGDESPILDLEPESAGRAWWGCRDDDDFVPVTDSDTICRILSPFGIKRFGKNETGTSVIIPYLDTCRLLHDVIPNDKGSDENTEDNAVEDSGAKFIREDLKKYYKYKFASDIADYLRLTVQRWYAPKIHNRELAKMNLECPHKWMRVCINDEWVRSDSMIPFFRLVQELYTSALAKANGGEYSSEKFPDIKVNDIKIYNVFGGSSVAGCVSMITISESMIAGGRLYPYYYFGNFDAVGEDNKPILMYARNPGMVIEYACSNNRWVDKIPPTYRNENGEREYTVLFFVPDMRRDKVITRGDGCTGMCLSEYLRRCEISDHMGWNDPVGMGVDIVSKIISGISRQAGRCRHKESREKTDAKFDSGLSHRIGALLMPLRSPGRRNVSQREPGGRINDGGVGRTGSPRLFYEVKKIEAGRTIIGFRLETRGSETCFLSLAVATEDYKTGVNALKPSSWREEINNDYPIQSVRWNVDTERVDLVSDSDYPWEVELRCGDESTNYEIAGEVSFEINDKKYRIDLSATTKSTRG